MLIFARDRRRWLETCFERRTARTRTSHGASRARGGPATVQLGSKQRAFAAALLQVATITSVVSLADLDADHEARTVAYLPRVRSASEALSLPWRPGSSCDRSPAAAINAPLRSAASAAAPSLHAFLPAALAVCAPSAVVPSSAPVPPVPHYHCRHTQHRRRRRVPPVRPHP